MKKGNGSPAGIFLALIFTVTVTARAAQVAWWKMDDNAASAAVVDSSGNAHNGVFYASTAGLTTQNTSAAHSADRPEGSGSFIFNGANNHIRVAGFKGITGSNPRTCAAWVKTTATQTSSIVAWGTTFAEGGEPAEGKSWVFRVESTGQLGVGVWGGNIKTTSTVLKDNTWHHVAAILPSGATNVSQVILYIDGVPQATTTSARIINTSSVSDVRIGAFTGTQGDNSNDHFKGLLDDVRIYDSALSQAQIQALNTWGPSPRDGAVNVGINSDLSWSTQSGALSYDVYFGTDPIVVADAGQAPSDINGDGGIDINDLFLLAGQWLTDGSGTPSADIDDSGKVDLFDFADLAAMWNQQTVYRGNQIGTIYDPGTLAYNKNYWWRVDVVDASETTAGPVRLFTTGTDGNPPAAAVNPSPSDDAVDVATATSYSWDAAEGATSYKVYRGTSLPLSATPVATLTVPYMTSSALAIDMTYYWRVDAINVSGTTAGTTWSFTTIAQPPSPVNNLSPANGENFVSSYTDLSWNAATHATSYEVYCGTSNPPPFAGATALTTFDPGLLTPNLTYYWRVDAVNDVGTTSGTVWSFTTEERLTPEQFVILPWDGPTRNFSKTYSVEVCNTIRDCGFNLAGFVEKDKLDNVSAAGLKTIVFDYNTSPLTENMLNYTDEQINYWVNWLVSQVGTHPANIGYYLRDEPGSETWWGLARWRAAFKTAAPTKLAYMSLGWNYDFANYLAVTGQDDFLSYDFYGCNEDGTLNEYYFPNLENALNASKTSGLPFWNTVASVKMEGGNGFPPTATPNPANLRFQAYTSLAYGVKGISWFTYFSAFELAPIVYDSKTAVWYYLQDVNMQIHRIGQTYVGLTHNNVFHHPNVPTAQPWMNYGSKGLSQSLYVSNITGGDYVVGEFTGPSSTKYLMVVNKSLADNAAVNIAFKTAVGTVKYVDPATGLLQNFSQGQTLLPGAGLLMKLN